MATVRFDGETGSPELNRITAKKNYASSMQSHKMGATYMFDALHYYMGEEMYPDLRNEVEGHVAVKQLPVYAFEKTLIEGTTDQYNHTYIGNFTVGADKGDNNWFGLTDEAVKNTAIRLEGTDHIKGVGFNYPWEVNGVKTIRYNADKEALCIVTGSDTTTWSAILEQSYCGTAETEEEIEAYLEQEFKPAYECAYHANPLLVGVTQTLAEINADVEAFKKLRRSDGRPYSYCEFWIDGEYDLYYLNLERNQYEKNGVNLYDELSDNEKAIVDAATTLEQKNQVFINFRIARFKAVAPNYWHINDGVFQLSFLTTIGASDNLEKNMYPYKLTPLSEGGRWRFFQDDLDSIKATDNQGQDTKPYSVELHDFTDDTQSAYVFKGEDNAYFQALEMAFPERLQKMGKDMLQAMYDLSPKGTKTLDKLMGFFDEYFFSRAQDYFTKSAYNNDAEYSYEEAWNNKEYVASVDINPLAQSMGDHYTTERAWVEKRMIYLMSKYGFGGFASYEDSGLGIISVRTQDPQGFTLTPAIDSYPTILGGQAQTSRAIERIKAGEAIQLAAVGGGNTNTYIVGADWLSDIGDLKDLSIDPSSVVVLSVASKRLRRLKVGDENAEEVTSYLATLSVQQCDSMETVDARNLTTLVGTVDLSKCPRLLEALFGGTNVTGVIIAAGSKVEHVQIPDSVTAIDLRNTKFLDTFEYGTLANLGFLRLENVPTIDAFAVLKEAYNADGSQLKDIRLVGFNFNGDATDLDMISNLASDKDKDGNDHPYNGIDADGTPTTSNPVLEGKLNIDGYVYEDTANVVQQLYPTIEFTPKGYYIRFQDPEVLRVLLANGVGDGVGITKEAAEKVTSIGTWFMNNVNIVSFQEFNMFTNVKSLVLNAFWRCTSLSRIMLPNSITTFSEGNANYGVFQECSSLKSVVANGVTTIGRAAFKGCSQLSDISLNYDNIVKISQDGFNSCTSLEIEDLSLPNLETLGSNAFYGVKIKKISNLGKITALPDTTSSTQNFGDKSTLEEIVLPDTVTVLPTNMCTGYSALMYCKLPNYISIIPNDCFNGCSSLLKIELPASVTTLNKNCFNGCSSLSEINVENVETISVGNFTCMFTSKKLPEHIIFSKLKNIYSTWSSYGVFYNTNVRKMEFPNVETVTGRWCFYGNNMVGDEEVIIGDKLTKIDGSIGDYLNASVNNLVINTITVPELTQSSYIEPVSHIYVPDASVEAYKQATNWSAYADRIMSRFYYLGYIDFADSAVRDICVANFDTDADGKISMEEAAAVTDIGTKFKGNTSITSFDEFKYFTGVTEIKSNAFYKCANLKHINLDNGSIKIISGYSFVDTSLEGTITIPKSITSISGNAFSNTKISEVKVCGTVCPTPSATVNCSNYTRIYPSEDNELYQEIEGCLFSSDGTILYAVPNASNVPSLSSVTQIYKEAMSNNLVTTKVTIPSNVTYLGEHSFRNGSIKTIVIDCVATFAGKTFESDSLKTIIFKKNKTIDSSYPYVYSKLSAMILDVEDEISMTASSFSQNPIAFGTGYIYVPSDLVASYQEAANWSTYASQIKPINVADTLPDISTVADNDLYKVSDVYWKAELVDEVLTWVEI